LGTGWLQAIHPEDRHRVVTLWKERVTAGRQFKAEYRFRRPDGTITWVLGEGVAEKADGPGLAGYVGTVTDITERKDTESQLEKAKEAAEDASRLKDRFLENMSHELRTPLTGIIGYTDMVKHRLSGDPQALEDLEVIERSGHHLHELISDILDLSRIEAGEMTGEHVACSPLEIVDDAIHLVQIQAEKKGLVLTRRLETPIPASILSDPLRI